ncbi:MAG: beta-ketoacyl-[acyl-carrier-protein] synthase family protein [Syntrophales bacterium]|nr:beta-ketoacyl-[acyl-carrier-protein] synthase family protein [Syntrophales bacterium]
MQRKRVVITGMGTVNALGKSTDEFACSLKNGKCGIAPLTLFDTSPYRTQTGAEIRDLSPLDLVPPSFSRKRLSRADTMAIAATVEALQDAGLFPFPESLTEHTGIILGAGSGGKLEAESVYETYLQSGSRRAHFSRLAGFCPASSADRIATALRIAGPKTTFMTACSSGATAIGFARDLIVQEAASVIIAGGVEPLSRTTYATFNALQALDPQYCKPFDRKRRGLSLGEGAAFLILETLSHALGRKARIHGEILGYGISCDSYHMTAPDPTGSGAVRSMRAALRDAGLSPTSVDYINAHGTATPTNDAMEVRAIQEVFGKDAGRIAISSIKSMTGHTLGASGALAAVASLIAIRDGFVPPTIHHETPDPGWDLDFVPNRARTAGLHTVLINAFAFGGNNTSLLLARYTEEGV